jgi:hypothetical protein
MNGPADRVAALQRRPLATGGPRAPGRRWPITERSYTSVRVSRPIPLDRVIAPGRHTNLPIHIWRWRYEIIVAAGLVIVSTIVLRTLGLTFGTLVLSAMLGVLSPPWPGWLTGLAWHVITPHRVRTGLSLARIHNRKGWHPLVCRITCEEFGERVVLWCPAGTTAEDVYSARAILRDACWATDVRVTCDALRSHIVTVDVIRRGDEHRPPVSEPRETGTGRYERAAVRR